MSFHGFFSLNEGVLGYLLEGYIVRGVAVQLREERVRWVVDLISGIRINSQKKFFLMMIFLGVWVFVVEMVIERQMEIGF